MPITPVSPVDKEKLVAVDAEIVIDLAYTPIHADINGLTVFDAGSFQAGWTGSLFNNPNGGKRLVLKAPTPFSLGQVVEVFVAETGGAQLLYRFQTGITRVTSDNTNRDPSVSLVPGGVSYLGYVKDSGELYVRFTSPLSPEVKLIQATVVDVGYDPTLNKLVVFFINNGRVYATTADPGDGPNSILPPGEAETPIKVAAFLSDDAPLSSTGSAGTYVSFGTTSLDKPVKQAPPVETALLSTVGSSGTYGVKVGFPQPIAPMVVSDNPRVLRLPRAGTTPESSYAAGFYLYKSNIDYAGGRFFPEFIPLPDGAQYVDYVDLSPTPKATYAVVNVYRNGQTTGTVKSELSSFDAALAASGAFGADVCMPSTLGGGGTYQTFATTSLDKPVKQATPIDGPAYVSTVGGAGTYQTFGR